jgi:hypothetical protein
LLSSPNATEGANVEDVTTIENARILAKGLIGELPSVVFERKYGVGSRPWQPPYSVFSEVRNS